ncbi:MAG: helix-turn-helix domain-containing protein [Candidatus Binatia bacterium]
MTPRSPYLATADVARLLGITPAAIRQMVRRGALIPAATTERGMRLFDRRDIEAFATKRRRAEARHGR